MAGVSVAAALPLSFGIREMDRKTDRVSIWLAVASALLAPCIARAHDPHGMGIAAVTSLPITLVLGIILVRSARKLARKATQNQSDAVGYGARLGASILAVIVAFWSLEYVFVAVYWMYDSFFRSLDTTSVASAIALLCVIATIATFVTVFRNRKASVAQLSSQEELDLSARNVTDADLVRLPRMPNLKRLCLSFTRVTDAGLEILKSFSSLKELRLNHTRITDRGVEHLKGMPQLSRISLTGTKVTETGIRELKSVLPDLEIVD